MQARARSLRSQALLPLPPELLPDTERAEHPIENIFNVDGSNQLLEYVDGSSQMNGRDWRRKFFLAPGLLELPDFHEGCSECLSVACPGQHWEIRNDLSVCRSNCFVNRVEQALETLTSMRADTNDTVAA